MKVKLKPRAKQLNEILMSRKPGRHKPPDAKTRQQLKQELKVQVDQEIKG